MVRMPPSICLSLPTNTEKESAPVNPDNTCPEFDMFYFGNYPAPSFFQTPLEFPLRSSSRLYSKLFFEAMDEFMCKKLCGCISHLSSFEFLVGLTFSIAKY